MQKLSKEDYKKYLQMLGQELQSRQMTGEILVVDNVMVFLDIVKPEAHKDIDAYLAGDETAIDVPRDINLYFSGNGLVMREAAKDIATREGLPENWLRNALEELFYIQASQEKWVEYPGLRAYLALPEHALAIKVATANLPQDIGDIKILAEKLHISNAQYMLRCVMEYIPEKLLTPEMRSAAEQSFT